MKKKRELNILISTLVAVLHNVTIMTDLSIKITELLLIFNLSTAYH